MSTNSYGAVGASNGGDFGDQESESILTSGDEKPKKSYRTAIVSALVGIITAAYLVLLASVRQNALLHSKEQFVLKPTTDTKIGISSVSNEYGVHDRSFTFSYSFLKDSFLIEPYKPTTIILDTTVTAGCSHQWSFTKKGNNSVSSHGLSSDGAIVATLSAVGEYAFEVSEVCDQRTILQLNMTVWVKYVRRELRSLTDQDREAFLDAYHTLFTVSTIKGRELYGERYKSVKYFSTLHNDAGGNSVCDEYHGGKGFLTNHMFLSSYFEQSLQLVNPAVALHYMEYSKYFESPEFGKYLHNQLKGNSWNEILSSKYFGASDPITGRILNGRWENVTIPYMTADFFEEEGLDNTHTFFPSEEREWLTKSTAHMTSPYGLLRSPWNYNPSPYLARYGNVFQITDTAQLGRSGDAVFKSHMGVHCSDYDSFFTITKGKSFESYLSAIESDTHGSFHYTFGGVGGKISEAAIEILSLRYGFTHSNIATLATSAQAFFKKNLARSHTDPVNCTANPWLHGVLKGRERGGGKGKGKGKGKEAADPGSYPGPTCDFSDNFYESDKSLNSLISSFFHVDSDNDDRVQTRLYNLNFEDRVGAMRVIGNMFPYDGDLAGSGGAMDPLFWIAHGAIERMFQKATFSGMFSEMQYTSEDHCSGHSATGRKSWLTGYHFTDESVAPQLLTNAELTNILNPTSAEYRDLLHFVYDSSSYDWCANSATWFE